MNLKITLNHPFFGDAVQYLNSGEPVARFTKPNIEIKIKQIPTPTTGKKNISTVTHPEYDECSSDWDEWRLTFNGGRRYVEHFLERMSTRENAIEFHLRKRVTPIPAFAKGAINEIKNSIFQRISDTVRTGGPDSYQQAIKGNLGGVDLTGSGINFFIGNKIINELLTMKKVGVLVENYPDLGLTLSEKGAKHPYFCVYCAEDIRNWVPAPPSSGRKFNAVVLRHVDYSLDSVTNLPDGEKITFRHYFINGEGKVSLDIYDHEGKNPIRYELNLTEIPYVEFKLSDSLLKDITSHQIALLNIESADVSQILKSGFPFYTEQQSDKRGSQYLRSARTVIPNQLGLKLTPGGNEPAPFNDNGFCYPEETDDEQNIKVGATHGRVYGQNLERPGFIAPPMDPLRASMEKQDRLKADIRILVHLALSNLSPTTQSAESKQMDQTGLEAGLSYIGLELEQGERQLGHFFSVYEGSKDEPTVNYPTRWSIKSDQERRESVDHLIKIRDEVPSIKYRKELSKQIVDESIGHRITDLDRTSIFNQIDSANYISADIKDITADLYNGLVSNETASNARGYNAILELPKAQAEKAERLTLIQKAQTSPDPAARGIPDASTNPNAGSQEKAGLPVRGDGVNSSGNA